MKTTRNFLLMCVLCFISSTFMSCEEEEIETWEATSISYMLTMSPDLLKFVYPEVTYVDSKGEIRTISGVQELDSLVNATFTYTPGNGIWTIQTIDGTNYKAWTLNMSFESPFYSYFGVKYKKLDLVEDTTDMTYDFHHSIFTTTVYATSHLSTTTKVNWLGNVSTEFGFGSGALVENHISFTKNSIYTGREAENYINELVNTPDKAGYYIEKGGKFTKNNDFDF